MRLVLMGFATMIAILLADMPSGSAQESFFNARYCTRSMGFGGGLDCAFHTWEQCIASARGLGRSCMENPQWRGGAAGGKEKTQRPKSGRGSEYN